jgi:hypothetical protein
MKGVANRDFQGRCRFRHAGMEDWARFGKVRAKWEKYLRGSEPKKRAKKS